MAAKKTTKKAAEKKAKAKKDAGEKKPKRTSALDAAAQILAGTKEAMNCKRLIETTAAKGLWSSPGGKTPHATLHTAVT
jgi:hypothetical protein